MPLFPTPLSVKLALVALLAMGFLIYILIGDVRRYRARSDKKKFWLYDALNALFTVFWLPRVMNPMFPPEPGKSLFAVNVVVLGLLAIGLWDIFPPAAYFFAAIFLFGAAYGIARLFNRYDEALDFLFENFPCRRLWKAFERNEIDPEERAAQIVQAVSATDNPLLNERSHEFSESELLTRAQRTKESSEVRAPISVSGRKLSEDFLLIVGACIPPAILMLTLIGSVFIFREAAIAGLLIFGIPALAIASLCAGVILLIALYRIFVQRRFVAAILAIILTSPVCACQLYLMSKIGPMSELTKKRALGEEASQVCPYLFDALEASSDKFTLFPWNTLMECQESPDYCSNEIGIGRMLTINADQLLRYCSTNEKCSHLELTFYRQKNLGDLHRGPTGTSFSIKIDSPVGFEKSDNGLRVRGTAELRCVVTGSKNVTMQYKKAIGQHH